MKKKDLQLFIWKICDEYGLSKKVLLVDNLNDVPKEYNELHMLINALNHVKHNYQNENENFLEAYKHFSYLHRKWKLSNEEFQTKFELYKSKNTPNNTNLILS